jgi:prepilin-type N-terminal cleavage/methylation domain-containing protein
MVERQVIIMKDRKGFTLAELLIVVAIIGVLAAISIPIFSTQLEKARDATSVANLRSAYAEAQAEYLNPDLSMRSGKGLVIRSNGEITMSVNFESATSSTISSIAVYSVDIESKKRNNWSGLGENLPFYSTLQPDPGSHGDIGKAGKLKYVVFTYDKDGNITETRLI